jgi:hypothetical protein
MGDIINSVADVFGIGPASKQADATTSAAQTSANAQLAAAQTAADAAKFRPVGVTSRFGTSQFGFSPSGDLTSAGYTLSPELQGYQNLLGQATKESVGDTQGLLNLGRGYLAEDPNAVRQRYMDQQNALLAPQNEQALAGLRNNLFQTGRQGLATGATTAGGMGATNPELAAYYNSLAQQQSQLAAGAEQAAQQQTNYGLGLLSSAYSPFQTALGLQSTVENLGQDALTLGANLGGKALQGGATASNALLTGGLGAANTMFKANAMSPTASMMSGFGKSGLGSSIDQSIIDYGKQAYYNATLPDWTTPSTFNTTGNEYAQMGTEQGWW